VHGPRPLGDGRCHLPFDVCNAEAAADAAFRKPVLDHERAESGDLLGESGDLEDLAADVRVNPDKLEVRQMPERVGPASAAAPEASEKPNFVSSCPVFTYSWVCASIPGVTRTNRRGR